MAWTRDDYTRAADGLFGALSAQGGTAAVVSLGIDGIDPTIRQFPSKAEAAPVYDELAGNPLGAAYVALYDRVSALSPNARLDEMYYGPTPAAFVVAKKTTRDFGPAKALAAVGIFGLVSVFAGRKKGRR